MAERINLPNYRRLVARLHQRLAVPQPARVRLLYPTALPALRGMLNRHPAR